MGGIACPAKAGVRRSVFHFTAIIPQFKNLARLGSLFTALFVMAVSAARCARRRTPTAISSDPQIAATRRDRREDRAPA